jgi:hypothetical protein
MKNKCSWKKMKYKKTYKIIQCMNKLILDVDHQLKNNKIKKVKTLINNLEFFMQL